MNRIINQYGAAVDSIADTLIRDIDIQASNFIEINDLTPEEIICLETKLIHGITAACAEGVLRKASSMKKEERRLSPIVWCP